MTQMTRASGLVFACVLDGRGGARALSWAGVREWTREQGVLWVHLDYAEPDARNWLLEGSGLDPIVLDALLASEPRPRGMRSGDGLLQILRGINLNKGAAPEDMVSVRVWADAGRVISMRHRQVNAVKDVRDLLLAGKGPRTPGGLLVELIDKTLDRIVYYVDQLDDAVHALEDQVLSAQSPALRHDLARQRRRAIAMRRYIAPQRDALSRLQIESVSWLSEVERAQLGEHADRMTRLVEDLDAARDRSAVTQEELASRLSEQINKRLYVLSLLTAVFLPLGLITGLWGANLGGVPGRETEWAFAAMAGALVGLSAVQLWLFRRLGWL